MAPKPARSAATISAAALSPPRGTLCRPTSKANTVSNKTADTGTPTANHSAKPMSNPKRSEATPASAALGGVPTKVAIPPTLAAYAMPRMSARPQRIAPPRSSSSPRTAVAMGNIMSVVAVLLIHMLNSAVASIKPKRVRRGPPPKAPRRRRANLRCKPCRSRAKASTNPPRNSQMKREPNGAAEADNSSTPKVGNNTKGRRLVAPIETAPLSHHHSIHQAVPASAASLTSPPVGSTNNATTKPMGPPHNAMAALGIMARVRCTQEGGPRCNTRQ